jgi:hypothetical protein
MLLQAPHCTIMGLRLASAPAGLPQKRSAALQWAAAARLFSTFSLAFRGAEGNSKQRSGSPELHLTRVSALGHLLGPSRM